MRLFILLIVISIAAAGCKLTKNKHLNIESEKVDKIEVYKGYPGEEVSMKDNFKDGLLRDLNNAKKVLPHKYIKPYRILIYYNTGIIDSITTNGTLHIKNGYYESNENLIDKYKK